jgi:hypothetical protein
MGRRFPADGMDEWMSDSQLQAACETSGYLAEVNVTMKDFQLLVKAWIAAH